MAATDAGIGSLGVKLSVDTAEFSAGLDRAAQISQREMRRIERANQVAAKEVDRLAAQVQRQIDTFGLSGTALLRYEAQVKGATDRVGPLIDRLEALRRGTAANDAAFAASARGLSQYGVSAGQTAAAMRQLPAQFTDIVTSLQGGQNPLTVLLQQGGQIKDSFGGIRPALAGLASAFNPVSAGVSALAVAATGLATAFTMGERESVTLARSLQLTGGAAGITAGQYQALARTIADSTTTSIGSAKDTLQALISSGRFTGETLTAAATAAQSFAKATGESAEDVAKRFVSMADGVAKGAESLNRQYNFLTAAQLAYIKTLEDQGRSQEALRVTFQALDDHMGRAAQNLGTLERGWGAVKRAASSAIDAMLSIGRVKMPEQQLAEAEQRLTQMRQLAQEGPSIFSDRRVMRPDAAALAAQEETVRSMRQQVFLGQERAAQRAQETQREQAITAFNALKERSMSRQEQRAKAIADATAKADAAGASAADRAKVLAKINDDFKEPAARRARRVATGPVDDPARQQRDNALRDEERALALSREVAQQHNRLLDLDNARGLLSIQSYYDARREIMENATAQQVAIYDRQIAALVAYRDRQKRATDRAETQGRVDEVEERRAALLRQAAFAATEMGEQQTAAQEAFRRSIEDVNAELLQLQGNLAAAAAVRFDAANLQRRQSFEKNDEPEAVRRLDTVRQLTIAQAAYSQQQTEAQRITEGLRITEERIALAERLGATTTLGALQQVGVARQEAVRQMEAVVAAQEAIARASESPALVLQAERSRLALEELRGSADVAGDRVRAIFDTATADAFSGFIGGTKSASQAFQAFADSILRDLSRIASQQITSGLTGGKGGWMDQIVKAVGSYIGGGSTQGTAVSPVEYMGYANGGAFDRGGEVRFASGGVVTRATPFKFASGGSFRSGVMGEAGPEAIMPLARGPNGKLGVVAQGAGNGGDVYVVVENHGGSQVEQRETTRPDGSREIRLIIEAAKAAVAEDVRREGGIASALQSTYGLNRGAGVMRGR